MTDLIRSVITEQFALGLLIGFMGGGLMMSRAYRDRIREIARFEPGRERQ